MNATATYQDMYAGQVEVTWTPMRSDKTRGFWKSKDGATYGGQARAMTQARCVSYAKQHRMFSNVEVA